MDSDPHSAVLYQSIYVIFRPLKNEALCFCLFLLESFLKKFGKLYVSVYLSIFCKQSSLFLFVSVCLCWFCKLSYMCLFVYLNFVNKTLLFIYDNHSKDNQLAVNRATSALDLPQSVCY